jgi:DNA polymerase elongation subunit (family B)
MMSTAPKAFSAHASRAKNTACRKSWEIWHGRDEAKRHGNKPLSQALKIIMNAFYGVLGTSACRFFDPRLASSITMRGHEIMRQTKALIESRAMTSSTAIRTPPLCGLRARIPKTTPRKSAKRWSPS